jgi:hypothetical protein
MYGIRPHRPKTQEELKRQEELSKEYFSMINKEEIEKLLSEDQEADDLL